MHFLHFSLYLYFLLVSGFPPFYFQVLHLCLVVDPALDCFHLCTLSFCINSPCLPFSVFGLGEVFDCVPQGIICRVLWVVLSMYAWNRSLVHIAN